MPVFPKRTACIAASALLSVSAFAADCINGVNPAGVCTVPAGAGSVTIEAWGGGGGGGGGDNVTLFGGGGGGGGSYCKATFAVAPGTPLTVAVGFGAPGGLVLASGAVGMPSSVTGAGVVGMVANAGSGGITGGAGGAGGDATACTAAGAVKWLGGNGAFGVLTNGGGGGGSATAVTAGGNGVGTLGGAGEGLGGNVTMPGLAPGGGGGGGNFFTDGSAGAAGQVKMTFVAAPVAAATPVPTVSAGGLVGLSALLAIFGMARARRRQG
ncbi:IPTL-CTERM sorting domain-containing protein [Ramlibacter sp. H39-3-26]|uniref:IPTL-CTERM sorting domain-containing protein n=1 Tax=Curvibacter soli TaxID=3031331 RepID=UPI0023DC2AA4|nr:IPTL-CTERM sorting domain-containing protein [Ramlibacter sp. H39-3-26]MDF1485603.1 IPTL-CTERM sorting domain-containing protein [Ramlibacter sp. H39-3-26]